MNSPLKDFFEHERDQVFTPGPYFSKRVVARLSEKPEREFGIWDVGPTSVRPVFALALTLILGFLAFDVFVPRQPERGMVEASLDADQGPVESVLYSETEAPDSQELFVEIMGLGEQ